MDSYLIGFIASDGHNAGNYWSVCQTESGIDVLIKIKKKYNYNYKEVKKSDWGKQRKFIMQNSNKYQCRYLNDWGIPCGNKTYSLIFPNNKSDVEIWHYLRGMFDGDGSFSYEQNKYPRVEIISNINWCKGCLLFLTKFGINAFISNDKRHVNIASICIKNIKSVHIFFNKLYENNGKYIIYMDRKFNKWNKFKCIYNYIKCMETIFNEQKEKLYKINFLDLNESQINKMCFDCINSNSLLKF